MSKQTINLGDIAIPVGSYESNGQTKKRYRHIGALMETVEDDGSRHRWLRLNADILHASLYALSRSHAEKGSDSVIASVFEPRDKPAAASKPEARPDGDQGPF